MYNSVGPSLKASSSARTYLGYLAALAQVIALVELVATMGWRLLTKRSSWASANFTAHSFFTFGLELDSKSTRTCWNQSVTPVGRG